MTNPETMEHHAFLPSNRSNACIFRDAEFICAREEDSPCHVPVEETIQKGTRLHNKTSDDYATVLYVGNDRDITIIVDGYAASDGYELTDLLEQWEIVDG